MDSKHDGQKNKIKIIIFCVIGLVLAASLVTVYVLRNRGFDFGDFLSPKEFSGRVITSSLALDDLNIAKVGQGEIVVRGEYDVKIQPADDSEKVMLAGATTTLKQAHEIAYPEAELWAEDVKLISISSAGALNIDGHAAAWRLLYASARLERAYEIVIKGDSIISRRELEAETAGNNLPRSWYDSDEALLSLRYLDQFKDETISAISFYYSPVAASWAYGVAVGSAGQTVSMWVK